MMSSSSFTARTLNQLVVITEVEGDQPGLS